jgi:hypothetical protein
VSDHRADLQTDPGIPTLSTVLHPAELARYLDGVIDWDTSAEIRINVLRWKRRDRCTFEIALKPVGAGQDLLSSSVLETGGAPSGWRELIGKVYAEDHTDVYRTMEEIRRAGFEPDAEFGIPRAVAFLPSLRLLLYEKVPGIRARKMIVANGPNSIHAAERCALWLAQFHARGPRCGPVFDLNDHLKALEAMRVAVAGADALFADKADRLFEQLAAAARGLGAYEMRAVHGTYTPGQVLVTEERTVTIDWDTYKVADPAYDVARFLVELKRMGWKSTGSTDTFRAEAEAFLQTYTHAAGVDVMSRVAFQEAAIFLDRAKHDIEKVDQQEQGWHEKPEAMLDEGLRVVAEDGWKDL